MMMHLGKAETEMTTLLSYGLVLTDQRVKL